MKKILSFLLLGLLLSIGNAWGEDEWVSTSLADLTSSDVFVIVGTNSNGNYAMSNDQGASKAPTAVAVTITDGKITSSVTDKIKWNISGNATDGYTFYPDGSTTTWLYCTNSNNGVRVGTNTAKTFKIVDNYINHVNTSRYLGVYNSQDWRCYTSINSNITGQTFSFYKKTTAAAVDLNSFAFANTTPSVTLSKNGNFYEADYTQTVTANPAAYDGAITYAIDAENSTFDTNNVIIDGETGELTISTTNNVGGTIVVKASGEATASYNAPADATYTLTVNAAPAGVGTPTFSLATGSYYYGTTVEIEAINADLITYTTDGTTPTMESTTYSAPVAITKTMTLKAKAWDSDLNESEVASIDFTLKAPEAPTFSVEGGEVIQGSTVTLTPGEGGEVIVYTTDGSTPTIESDIYTEAITINAAMTIKAATVDDGDNLSTIASYDFTVIKVDVYEKVTDASTLAAGDQLLLVYENGNLALGAINGNGKIYDYASVTISSSKISNPSASVAVLTLGGDSEGWTLQSSLDSKYLSLPSSSNELRQSATAVTDNDKWTISIEEGVASVTNVAYDTRTIKYNSGSPRFACYTTGQQSLALYRLKEDLTETTITINPSENFELNYGGSKVLTVTASSGAEITAKSSDEDIATVAKTGENEYTVTAVSGTEQGVDATITFTAAKTATHKAATSTVTATVKDTRTAAPISFAVSEVTKDLEDSYTGQALINEESLDVTWNSSNENVATVENGTVTLVGEGETTISATFNGNNTYKLTTMEYTLTVTYVNKPGSENNPYTVAQARAAIDAGTGVIGVYATGIVSEIVTEYSSQYHNISYNISADGSTTGDQLQAYRGKGFNGANFTSEDDIKVGDVVVIYGTLKKYNDIYEFDANNQLKSFTHYITLGANGWSTYAANFKYTVSGATVYTAALSTTDANYVILNAADANAVIPANAGIILKGESSGATATITASAEDATTLTENQLVGVVEEVNSFNVANAYILATNVDGDGLTKFHLYEGSIFPAHKAYMVIEGANNAPIRIEFAENNTTDINAIEASEKAVKFFENGKIFILRDGVVYDATGRVVR